MPKQKTPQGVITDNAESVVKGASDTAEYSSHTLSNGIRVVLICDPSTKKEAVLMDIDAGAEHDTHPGIARIVDHFIMNGSRKYPKGDNYRSFANKHRGSSETQTEMTNITYYYQIPTDADEKILNDAIDRFSQFFIDPLFNENEAQSALTRHNIAYFVLSGVFAHQHMMVYKNYYTPDHPMKRFIMGNTKLLAGVDLRAEAMEFYKKHHVPKNMVLVMLTRRNKESAKQVLAEMFGRIPMSTEGVPRRMVGECPYLPEIFSHILWVESESKCADLHVKYILPEESLSVEAPPHRYLAEMLLCDGEGSLIDCLAERGLVDNICTIFDAQRSYRYGEFHIEVRLTPMGLRRHRDVISIILAYIDALKDEPVRLDVLQNMQTYLQVCFDNCSYIHQNTFEQLKVRAQDFRNCGFARMISNRYLMTKIDADAIAAFNKMVGSSFYVMIFDPDFPSVPDNSGQGHKHEVLTEQWFGSKYAKTEYTRGDDAEMVQLMKSKISSLVYVPLDVFVSTNMEIKYKGAPGNDIPVLLADDSRFRLWHSMDSVFGNPDAIVAITFRGNYRLVSAKNETLFGFYHFMAKKIVKSRLFALRNSGYRISVDNELDPRRGLIIRVCGNDEKIGAAVGEVMRMLTPAAMFRNDAFFDNLRSNYKHELLGVVNDKMIDRMHVYLSHCMQNGVHVFSSQLGCIDAVGIEDMRAFAREFFGSSKTEILVYGNVYAAEAKRIYTDVSRIITAQYPLVHEFEFTTQRVKMPVDQTTFFHVSVPSNQSLFFLYIETGALDDCRNTVLTMLFDKVTMLFFFGQKEILESLGSGVQQQMLSDTFAQTMAYVVSTKKQMGMAYKCIVEFIDDLMPKFVADMSEQAFLKNKKSLMRNLTEREGMDEESKYIISKITDGTYNFDARNAQAEMLESLTKADLVRFVNEKITHRRCVCIAKIAESRYDAEIKSLRDSSNNFGHTLVHIDAGSLEKWRSEQKEHIALPDPVVHAVHGE